MRQLVHCGQCYYCRRHRPRCSHGPYRNRSRADHHQSIMDSTHRNRRCSHLRVSCGVVTQWDVQLGQCLSRTLGYIANVFGYRTIPWHDSALPGPCDQLGGPWWLVQCCQCHHKRPDRDQTGRPHGPHGDGRWANNDQPVVVGTIKHGWRRHPRIPH